jgi:adenosylcobyric acid synthase
MKARSLMVMGTASDAGKSVMVTALCRALARRGVRVAPFKAQNMSNNAAVCAGGEIGRAQATQAEACGIEPRVDLNPVLLKPESERGCQVVIHGKARFRMGIDDYERYRHAAWPAIVESYRRLSHSFDVVVIEGAGGAAEINLRHRDIVNWAIAELADAPVLMVSDIDKGGVFAALLGTLMLLEPAERARVAGLIINKFRGDPRLLQEGLEMLAARAGVPVLGVLPYLTRLHIPHEDSSGLQTAGLRSSTAPIRMGVIHLPRISNYTDFAPFDDEPDVALDYFTDPATTPALDVVFIPGSKGTIGDLQWLRDAGWESYLAAHRGRGGLIVGICGGYQMLGRRILDPLGVESPLAVALGLGLLDIETTFAADKVTAAVQGIERHWRMPVTGYEIHAGRIAGPDTARPLFLLTQRHAAAVDEPEGAQSEDGRIRGTSLHGLFDLAPFRRHFLDRIRLAKGLGTLERGAGRDAVAMRIQAYDRLAEALERHCDFASITRLVGLS